MRRVPFTLAILALAAQSLFARVSDSEGYDKPYLEARLKKFQGMRNGGFTMAGVGAAALIGGIFLAANGDFETVDNGAGGTQANAQDASATFGVILIGAGIPMTIAGIVLGSIGNKKVSYYEGLLQGVSLEWGRGREGLRYSYSF